MPEDCRERIVSEEYKEEIVGYYGQTELLRKKECVEYINEDFAVVYEPLDGRTEEGISFSNPLLFGLLEEEALEISGVSRLRRIPGFDYRGRGILIGFADTGIDSRHPAFLFADGTSRVEAVWDQSDQSGRPPEGFFYGTEFSKEEIDAGNAPGDENGHGTFLAGVAAGNEDPENGFSGAAPLAGIVMVKLKEAKRYWKNFYCMPETVTAFSEADVMTAVRYLTGYAEKQGKPMVICLGIGSGLGSHRGNLPLSQYLNRLAYRSDLCIVTAVGNEGNARHHARLRLTQETVETELYVAERSSGFTMELYTEALAGLSLTILSPTGERSPELVQTAAEESVVPFLLERTTLYSTREGLTRNDTLQKVQLRFQTPMPGIWRIRMECRHPATVDLWLPLRGFLDTEIYFLVPEPEVTLCEPANAPLLLSVGGYSVQNGSPAPFSGRGFTGNGQIQPSLLAPAADMTGPFAGGGYITRSGTSAAAAFTAGCVALYMEYVDEYRAGGNVIPMDTVLLRNLFALGAAREEGIRYPSMLYGYGKLNLYGVFEFLRNL